MNKTDNIKFAAHLSPETFVDIFETILDEIRYYCGGEEAYKAIINELENYGFNFSTEDSQK